MIALQPRFLILLAFCLVVSAAEPIPTSPGLQSRSPDDHHHRHHHHHHGRDLITDIAMNENEPESTEDAPRTDQSDANSSPQTGDDSLMQYCLQDAGIRNDGIKLIQTDDKAFGQYKQCMQMGKIGSSETSRDGITTVQNGDGAKARTKTVTKRSTEADHHHHHHHHGRGDGAEGSSMKREEADDHSHSHSHSHTHTHDDGHTHNHDHTHHDHTHNHDHTHHDHTHHDHTHHDHHDYSHSHEHHHEHNH